MRAASSVFEADGGAENGNGDGVANDDGANTGDVAAAANGEVDGEHGGALEHGGVAHGVGDGEGGSSDEEESGEENPAVAETTTFIGLLDAPFGVETWRVGEIRLVNVLNVAELPPENIAGSRVESLIVDMPLWRIRRYRRTRPDAALCI